MPLAMAADSHSLGMLRIFKDWTTVTPAAPLKTFGPSTSVSCAAPAAGSCTHTRPFGSMRNGRSATTELCGTLKDFSVDSGMDRVTIPARKFLKSNGNHNLKKKSA
eukprot:3593637-Rhodomonas_salina.1